MARVAAPDDALVGLFMLVPLHPGDKTGGRREKLEAVIDRIDVGPAGPGCAGPSPLPGEAVAVGMSAVIAGERAKAADFAAVDSPFRHMFGSRPVGLVEHRRHGVTVGSRS